MTKVVLATGVFDLLHYGHLRFLEESKKAGGPETKLIVVVARDQTIKKRKGVKPILPEDQRRALVEALKPVETALLGYEEMDLERVIQELKPDIITIGYDQDDLYQSVSKIVKQRGFNVDVIRIGRFGPEDLNSSSKIKRKVIEGLKKP